MRLATWLVTLITACVLPLVAMAAWLAYDGVTARQAERKADADATARNFAIAIDQRLQARLAGLQVLARSPLLDEPPRWTEFYRVAQAYQTSFGSHVILAGKAGHSDEPLQMLMNTRIAVGNPLPPLPRPSGRAAVPMALQTGLPAVGDLFPGPIAQEALVALAVPVPGRRSTSLVVLTTPEASQFQQRLDQIALPDNWALSLLDSSGQVIARRAPVDFVPAQRSSLEGRHRVALSTAPWTVELEIPSDVLNAPTWEATRSLAAAIAAATALAIGGGLLVAHRLRNAVVTLAEPAGGAVLTSGIAEIDQVRLRLDDAAHRRDKALAAEREADARLQATFELANVGIAHVGLDGHWLRVNRRLCQIIGYTEAELLGSSFQDITHPDDLDADLMQVRQLLDGAIVDYEMDKRYRHRSGREVWVALSVALVRTPKGAPDYFISVVDDIDNRKRLEQRNRDQLVALTRSEAEGLRLLSLAERSRGALLNVLQDQKLASDALQASETRLRTVFEQASDGIFVIGADNRYLDANARGLEMLGFTREALLKRSVADVLAPHELSRLADESARMMSGKASLSEWDHVRRDGTGFPGEVSAKRLNDQSYLAIVRDVSARRETEQALLRYQEELSDLTHLLLEQERATTRRVAQALHDRLGQTLALARLRLGALLLRQGQSTPAEHEAALEQLGQLLEQAVNEARQVLADLRPPLLEDEGLAAALDNELRSPTLTSPSGMESLQPTMRATPAAKAQRWQGDVEYAAFMVAREAITNALRHAHAQRVEVLLDGGPGWLHLEVADDGIGLTPELAHGKPGHLGIVGMRERALAIGANFVVDSRPGGGTCMTFIWGG
jgi:PAS domain S-box-containing protein